MLYCILKTNDYINNIQEFFRLPMNNICESCHYSIFDSIGTQFYCVACDKINHNNDIQEEMMFVPAQYQSNSKNKKQLEMQRVINGFIRQFSDKYRDIHNSQEIGIIRSKIMRIKKTHRYSKNTRELVAAVVFCQLRDYVKQMNIRQFCKLNNVNMRKFHAKYKIYHKMFIQQGKRQVPVQQIKKQYKKIEYFDQYMIKVQQKMEEQHQNHDNHHYQNENMLIQQQNDGYLLNFKVDQSSQGESLIDKQKQDIMISSQQYHSSIMVIYDDIFINYYLKSKKKYVVQKLINKLKEIDYSSLEEIRSKEPNKCFRAYYLIYAVLKALGNKIVFGKYNQIIKDKTGYNLRVKTSHDIEQLLQNHSKVHQKPPQEISNYDGNIKIEQKYSQINQMTVPFSYMNVSLFYNEDEIFI